MNTDFTATISKSSPRYKEWKEVFFGETVILKHPIPKMGRFPEVGVKPFYELDLEALSERQRFMLVKHLSERFNISEADVKRDLEKVGVPILTDDVILTIKNPQKWL